MPELVGDICPAPCSGFPIYTTGAGIGVSKLYFPANDAGQIDPQLWVTDGSSAGTRKISLPVPLSFYGAEIADFVAVGDTLFFTSVTPAMNGWSERRRLWRSDGTQAGTGPVEFPVATGIDLAASPIRKAAGGALVQSAQGIWWVPQHAGTPPRKVAEGLFAGSVTIGPDNKTYFVSFACSDCFAEATIPLNAVDEHGTQSKLGDLQVRYNPFGPGVYVYLVATTAGVFASWGGDAIFFTDRTAPPSALFANPAGAGVLPLERYPQGRNALFRVIYSAPARGEIWASDGSTAGTGPITFIGALSGTTNTFMRLLGPVKGAPLLALPEQRFASRYDAPGYPLQAQLWNLDTSVAKGASPMRSFGTSWYCCDILAGAADGVYFWAPAADPIPNQSNPYVIWFTDGTTGGTQVVDAQMGEVAEIVGLMDDFLYYWKIDGAKIALYRINLLDGRRKFATVEVVEYRNAKLGHYFMTASDAEKVKLDSGATAGWSRTGFGFTAYAPGSGAPGAAPVCRYYGRPEAGLDSHFYSSSPAECAEVAAKFPAAWIREADNVFEVIQVDPKTVTCKSAGSPIYRAFNGRSDANHRYTSHVIDQMAMEDQGWKPEGVSSAGMVMCVPVAYRP